MSPLWYGATWTCQNDHCRFVNAVLRKKCRNCGTVRPTPALDESDLPVHQRKAPRDLTARDGFSVDHV